MNNLDRVFEGDDMPRIVTVDVVKKSRERRRLTSTRRPANEHQAVWQSCEPFYDLRKAEFGQRQNITFDGAKDGGRTCPLGEEVDAKTKAARGERVAEIDLFSLVKSVSLNDREMGKDEIANDLRAQDRAAKLLDLAHSLDG